MAKNKSDDAFNVQIVDADGSPRDGFHIVCPGCRGTGFTGEIKAGKGKITVTCHLCNGTRLFYVHKAMAVKATKRNFTPLMVVTTFNK